jgi:hypothetical protein
MGIAINNTRAFVEGVIGRQSPFVRTPKYALQGRGDSWRGKVYRPPLSAWAFAELALALYAAVTLGYAAARGHWLAVPFLFLYFVGGAYIGFLSVAHAWAARPRRRPSRERRPLPVLE